MRLLLPLAAAFVALIASGSAAASEPISDVRITIDPSRPTIEDEVVVTVSGPLPDSCRLTTFTMESFVNSRLISVNSREEAPTCTTDSFTITQNVGKLPAGPNYIEVAHYVPCCVCNPSPCYESLKVEVAKAAVLLPTSGGRPLTGERDIRLPIGGLLAIVGAILLSTTGGLGGYLSVRADNRRR